MARSCHRTKEPTITRIEETPLPGIGTRFDFSTRDGERIGVVHHHTGRREVFVCTRDDPDGAAISFDLDEDEAHSLIDVLGGSQVVESLAGARQTIVGLAIDWLKVPAGSVWVGRPISSTALRATTGASIVAVIRGDDHVPAPGPDFMIEMGDTLVVVGTPDGVLAAYDLVRSR